MKKLFAISLLAAMFMADAPDAKSQGIVTANMTSTVGGTTTSITCISNTANYIYVQPDQGHYTTAIFQATVTRVSAAAGGTIFLQGSVDNSNWHTATYAAGDTATVANSASQVLKIYVAPTSGLPFKYYRLKCTGASSDTMTVAAKFCGRQ